MADANDVFEIVPGKSDAGDHIFAVVVKRTFRIVEGEPVQRCISDHPLRRIDSYYDQGDPEWSTVQYESELAPYKPNVDVVVIGRAYAPGGKPIPKMEVAVRVADCKKTIAVFGNRKCHYRPDMPPSFSDPEPFADLEIRYERSYGGRDHKSRPDIPFFYPRNDMGTGIAIGNQKETVEGLVLPNFEDPSDLLTPERIVLKEPKSWPEQPLPQGFGWFQRTWYPRSAFAGSYPPFVDIDTVTTEERIGLLPKGHVSLAKRFKLPSYQTRFNNGASHGMLSHTITGNENVALLGLTPSGLLEFRLPGENPEISLDLGAGAQLLEARLDTVSIRPDELEVDLIWRGICVYQGYSWLPQMKRLHAEVH